MAGVVLLQSAGGTGLISESKRKGKCVAVARQAAQCRHLGVLAAEFVHSLIRKQHMDGLRSPWCANP